MKHISNFVFAAMLIVSAGSASAQNIDEQALERELGRLESAIEAAESAGDQGRAEQLIEQMEAVLEAFENGGPIPTSSESGSSGITTAPSQPSKPNSAQTQSSAPRSGPLASANASIPSASRPVSAHVVLEQNWQGFPAILVQEAALHLSFAGGQTVTCAHWDPSRFSPASAGRLKGCKVKSGTEGKRAHGFRPGETVQVSFGNTGGSSTNLGGSSGVRLKKSDLRMTSDGRIAIGLVNVATGAAGNNRVNTWKKRGLTGRYYLDGHTITIQTDQGETIHGFIAATPGGGRIDHVFLMGSHYWKR